MGFAVIQSQIRSLELQLQILKAKLQKSKQLVSVKSFGDFYGILQGQVESTEEEIDDVLYSIPAASEL